MLANDLDVKLYRVDLSSVASKWIWETENPAFTRRIRFIVAFEPPGQAERERIWASAFPAGVPTDDLDVRLLAQLNISGTLIHSIALQSSSVAASTGSTVTTDSVLEVARREMRNLDRPINQPESP